MTARIHLTLTDEHPYAQAFVVIEARAHEGDLTGAPLAGAAIQRLATATPRESPFRPAMIDKTYTPVPNHSREEEAAPSAKLVEIIKTVV